MINHHHQPHSCHCSIMAKPPYLDQDFITKSYKPNKARGLSFFASILSLFIYISIFYTFNLSPYTLLKNNIFWFFMSNTLILIIAADYGAYSSSKKNQQDLYEEYVKHSQARHYAPKYEQFDEKYIDSKKGLGGEILKDENESTTEKNEIPERVLEIVVQNDTKKPSESFNEKKPVLAQQLEGSKEKAIPAARIYRRSKSDRPWKPKRVVFDESKNTMRRSEVLKIEKAEVEEENEFSRMSNEELNRRVEEFIERFNKQIRRQAARNIHQI